MLVQFAVSNFKTFKEEAKLTLFASNYDKTTLEEDNVFEVPKFGLRLLKSAVVYGANASGKTNLIEAAHFMKQFILESSKESQQGEPIDTDPFRLSTTTEGQPSRFELIFIHKEEMFRYGFETTREAVVSEWLYHRPNTKEVAIFSREGQNFQVHPKLFSKGSLVVKEKMVRSNALMLSVAAQFNDKLALQVFEWLNHFHQLSGVQEAAYLGYSINQMEGSKKRVLSLLKGADVGIEDLIAQKWELGDLPDKMPDFLKELISRKIQDEGEIVFSGVKTKHSKINEWDEVVGYEEFSMMEDESSGTQKFFALTGPIIHALDHGETLVVDELDSKVHSNLVRTLVGLFNSAWTNPKNAQLIFNTHDTNLLSSKLFRRDQIWFVEKNRFGAASLYSLASFKTDEVRKNDDFEQNYLNGRYGGIPVLGDFRTSFTVSETSPVP